MAPAPIAVSTAVANVAETDCTVEMLERLVLPCVNAATAAVYAALKTKDEAAIFLFLSLGVVVRKRIGENSYPTDYCC